MSTSEKKERLIAEKIEGYVFPFEDSESICFNRLRQLVSMPNYRSNTSSAAAEALRLWIEDNSSSSGYRSASVTPLCSGKGVVGYKWDLYFNLAGCAKVAHATGSGDWSQTALTDALYNALVQNI